MNFILLSDPHATLIKPASRMDNIIKAFTTKFQFILDYAGRHDFPIFISGDLFDRAQEWKAMFLIMDMIRKSQVSVYVVYGQHDMYARVSEKSVTSINVLIKSGIVTLLKSEPITIRGINVYGSSWGEGIPVPKEGNKKNMLVAHKPVYQSRLFYKQKGMDVEAFAKKCRLYDIVHLGDIHRKFLYIGSTIIVNTGPLMRLEATRYNMRHAPAFAIYKIKSQEVEFVIVPHEPGRRVLDINHRKEIKKKKVFLEEFTASLKKIDFQTYQGKVREDINRYIEENEIEEDVIDALNEIMVETNGS